MTEKLPHEVNQFIGKYFNLDILGTKVRSPYYRNVKRVRAGLSSLIGKGTPEEITEETIIYAKLRDFYFTDKSEKEIRKFMESQGIGIDCSGFITQILNYWLRFSLERGIYHHMNYPSGNLRAKLARRLRVVENIGANLLTSQLNADPLDIKDVKPGDLIRMRGAKRGYHVAMVYSVRKDPQRNAVQSIRYVHSSEHYGENNGVKYGKINFSDLNKELSQQEWLEIDEKTGVNYTFNGYMNEKEDNGLRRVKFAHKLKWSKH